MTIPLRGHPIVAAALVAAITGCGGSGGSEPGASTPASTSAPRGTTASSNIDACALVTQDEASALFGQPATRQEGSKIAVPIMIGECIWTWDAPAANQLLQFRVWNTEKAYSRPTDEFVQDFPLGQRGHVHAHPQGGVSIEWVQDGRMIGLSYSGVGSAVPSPLTKAEAMKELARKVAGKL